MGSVKFDRKFLTDFNNSSKREFIETNDLGAYCSSTLAGVNTRKYHGTFVVRQPQIDSHSYVLLNVLHEVAEVDDRIYELGVHQYSFTAYPRGFVFQDSFELAKIPTWIYELDRHKIKKEIQFTPNKNQLLIKYTLIKGDNIRFGVRPFSSFRRIHKLRTVDSSDVEVGTIKNGISYKLEAHYDKLHIQTSIPNEFLGNGKWHYQAEYLEELNRGYDFKEDLYSVGLISFDLKKDEPVVISISTQEEHVEGINAKFNKVLKDKPVLDSLGAYLEKAADQFISKTEDHGVEIGAGYHWFGRWGRDTFLALPGLTLYRDNPQPEVCKNVLKTMLKDLKGGLLTNIGVGATAQYNSADASLWFFWALQEYADATRDYIEIWKDFKKEIVHILENYKTGTLFNIHMKENGLLYGGQKDIALTWMDAVVDGVPVTPRAGYVVELNALWYNAICFSLELADKSGDHEFFEKWSAIPKKLKPAFKDMFWDEKRGYLADVCEENSKDWSFRPNQTFATALKYSVCDEEMSKSVLINVKDKLLTSRGLMTLSQDDDKYIGIYQGDQKTRDSSYHQGIVWPWLLGHFTKGYLSLFGKSAVDLLSEIYQGFEEELYSYGIGTIAEIYDAEPPFKAKGTISQAWSVAELIRIKALLKQQKNIKQ